MDYKGTRWYKADLHLHTPASKCFNDKDVTPKEWVERCLEQELNVVAVTDHNTGAWINEIKNEAEGSGLVVLPGVEVTCSESKVHMLVLFDVDKNQQDVEDFLSRIKIDREDFATSDANSELSTIEVTEEANNVGAIAIPAHIDEFNGLSEIKYHNREKLLENENINGVQVVHQNFFEEVKDKKNIEESLFDYYKEKINEGIYTQWKVSVTQAKKHNKAILTFSDNPCEEGNPKHGLWGIGKRFTWLKMDEIVS